MAFNQLVAGSNPARPTKSRTYGHQLKIRLIKNGLSKKTRKNYAENSRSDEPEPAPCRRSTGINQGDSLVGRQ